MTACKTTGGDAWTPTMSRNHTLRRLSAATLGTLAAALTGPAWSQDGGYVYGGVGIGASRAKIDEPRISASLLGAGATSTTMTSDERDTGYRLFGGYQLNRYIGVEGGFFSLGKFGFNSTTVPAGTLNGRIKIDGLNLDLVGTLPLTGSLSAIARVGAQYARTRDNFSGGGSVTVFNPNPSKRALNSKFGAGLQYEVSRSFFIRAEGERYRVDDAVGNRGDVNVYSLSLVFPFGRSEAAAPRAMAAPVYVAAAPPPPPPPAPVIAPPPAPAPAPIVAPVVAPVAVVAAPPPRRRVSFAADSLFAFDRSEVGPAGRQALDRFIADLAGTSFETITVEGHTDRLGSDTYNRKLSEQRADAVKAYLVRAGAIDARKVLAIGKGETAPLTGGSCKGSKPSAQLIACMQPDRRVVVEVAGTR